jgi:hypothetical protein
MANDNAVTSNPMQSTGAASDATLYHLSRVDNQTLMQLSELSIPEVEELKKEIATIFPAGNLPGLILSGLTQLDGRKITRKKADEDISTLFQGAKLLPKGLYSILFAGPAVVLATYQKMLTLAGKTTEEAFPEGLWQFYLQFALREDTGRHTNETIAYHRDRPARATLLDDISAWVMTAINALFDTDALAGTLWTEWTALRLICDALVEAKIVDESPYEAVLRDWQLSRPYRTQAGVSYAEQRRQAFEVFAQRYYEQLPTPLLQKINIELQALAEQEREAFQQQLSMLAHLEPSRYRDERVPVRLWDARVGVIWRGHTYLFDVCAKDQQGRPLAFSDNGESWPLRFDGAGSPIDQQGNPLVIQGGWLYRFDARGNAQAVAYLMPPDPSYIKGLTQKITQTPRPPATSTIDIQLSQTPRGEQAKLRNLLPIETQEAIWSLANTPIIINWDQQDRSQPLAQLRRKAQRGVGDHPLTILRTLDSVVFDQSHIFFDSTWSLAMAEVLTNQAISWAHYMVTVPPGEVTKGPELLAFNSSSQFESRITALNEEFFEISAEASAESESIDLSLIETTRRWLRQRGVNLTISDLLLLARVLHSVQYTPNQKVAQRISSLPADLQREVVDSLEAMRGINPAMLIPMDASFINPRERISPVTFRNPLMGLFDAYDDAMAKLKLYRVSKDNSEVWTAFHASRKEMLSYLRAFEQTLGAIKLIANRGESLNVATLKLLGNLPPSMQHLLNQMPERVGMLNEIVKGEEVFSNVGRVASDSSLIRFVSAKDDGRAKRLVWGVLTDDKGELHVTLRDFRPHVIALLKHGQEALAYQLAKDYVDSYTATLVRLAGQLAEIALAEDKS